MARLAFTGTGTPPETCCTSGRPQSRGGATKRTGLIKRNIKRLERLGPWSCRATMVDIGGGAQREIQEYWLNKHQAIRIITLAETECAEDATAEVIEVVLAGMRAERRPCLQAIQWWPCSPTSGTRPARIVGTCSAACRQRAHRTT